MVNATKLPDWRKRLHAELTKTGEWAWGEWDCLTRAMDAVRAMTGVDPSEEFGLRGTYHSAEEACQACRARGVDFAGAFELLMRQAGATEVHPARAVRTGDLALVRDEWAGFGVAAGVSDAPGRIAVVHRSGARCNVDGAQALRTWRLMEGRGES